MGTAEEAVLLSATPSQDAQVREDTSTSNYAVSQTAGTSGLAAKRKTLLTSFDVSTIPAHAGIASAYVTLTYFNAPVGTGILEAHQVTSPWAESTVTWGTAPAYDATIAGQTSIVGGTTIAVDVTSIVTAWVNGAPNNGIALTETGGSAVYWTREAAAGVRPTLTVNWTAPATCTDGIANGGETDVDCGGATCGACVIGKHCAAASDCQSGYCGNGTCSAPPATCTDGIANGSETDVDCGGSCAAHCADGKRCGGGADCQSGYCGNGTCAPPPPTCTDGIANGTETDIDCGGSCAAHCADGKHCNGDADCQSGYCGNGTCAPPPPSCTDGIANGNETDIDCGGTCAQKCANTKRCGNDVDCLSGYCNGNDLCATPSCTDGAKNGGETDIDCGGPCGAKCATGRQCNASSDCQSSSCVGGLCAAPACNDGILNGNETDVDCGGSCLTCSGGQHCNTGADCGSQSCVGGVCAAPTCTDGIANGAETDIDCGGPCPACAMGQRCASGSDCGSSSCGGGQCAAPSCSDGVANGTETDVDCGGSCAADCAIGKHCASGADCTSKSCVAGLCVAPACNDGVLNGSETDTDCGGAACNKCAVSLHCNTGSDCASGACVGGLCAAPSCNDGIANGSETDVDCGGSCAADCAFGQHCASGADCGSSSCVGGLCAAPSCGDGVKNGTETDIDCGSNCPSRCANNLHCASGGDCVSGSCVGGLCAAPSCTDGVKNGSETDIDCGGSTSCNRCSNGKLCTANGDCTSNFCSGGVCAAALTASCTDGLKNGSETDVDCGGSCSAKCANGKLCNASTDCASGLCYSGTCYAQGVSGAVATSCTLPTIQTGYGESVRQYKPSVAKTGWGVLTTPPAGIAIKGAALVVHGGRWLDNSTGAGTGASPWPYDDNDTVRKLAKLGYVVFDPAYRSSATAKHPAQISDVLCAARYLRDTMAASYPTAPTGMFVLGASAGAHLSALLAYAPLNTIDDGTCPRTGSVTVRGVIGWSGVYDFTQTIPKASSAQAVADLLGFTPASNPAGALAASPWSYVNPLGADIMLAHGATDATLPAAGTTAFHTRALSLGVDSTNVIISGTFGIVHAGNLFDSTRPSMGCTALTFLAAH